MEKGVLNTSGIVIGVVTIFGAFTQFWWVNIADQVKPIWGEAIFDLVGSAIDLAIIAAGWMFLHYYGVIGAGAEATETCERRDYEKLRRDIAVGNWLERRYSPKLKALIGAVDRFFGDVGMAAPSPFRRVLGLSTPAPLWTAPAFDRCLMLALVYPVAVIILIWAIANHVGPAEAALGLAQMNGWRRFAVIASIGLQTFAFWRIPHAEGWHYWGWTGAAVALALVLASVFDVAIAYFIVFGFAVAYATFGGFFAGTAASPGAAVFAGALAFAGLFANALTGPVTGADVIAIAFAWLIAVFFAGAFAAMVTILGGIFAGRGWQGGFLALFLAIMLLACFAVAASQAHSREWKFTGPLFLFLGLLTLVNAPFDWLSLGLTRLSLRLSLRPGEWLPYIYAFINAGLASVMVAALAVVMVFSVQLFDDVAVHSGRPYARVLPPMRTFLDAIRGEPAKPEYWWVYAMFFSTMLPSLFNLFIAGWSLARRSLKRWLLGKLVEGEAVPWYDRMQVAAVLTVRGVAAFAFAIIVQGVLAYVIIWKTLLGGVLDLAYSIAH